MENKRKMFFFDIDGTLITEDERKLFPESTREAIRLVRKKGHLTFINTGRVLVNIEKYIKNAGFDGFVCGCGTNIISGGCELFHNILDREFCRKVAYMSRECNMKTFFEHRDLSAFDRAIDPGKCIGILNYFRGMNKLFVDDIDSERFVFDKFAAWYDENSDFKRFKEYISEYFMCIDRGEGFIEAVPKGYSKATGIEFLKNYYKIADENIYAFGDSNNDLDMLRYVKNSIAMGVCSDEVARAALYRTDTVENDGIYKAMKHFEVI